ncbi:NADP-dependent oxidoreductase domain-containing protein [Gilbertella persicaria]|uniref:NADP-dependent oxidoreductase domain-containing protein n=1 Tax=Gilbertella persicaria TaxID=101096 RepID=UPI002220E6F3|nr:NADP-dependent oxidoreductase domain-containing protein [Gilbertella persicaria]KAI8088067.1 NADP-dependent oxidoreductase domain-containing protein [Gilbertella persicaria]
MGKSIVKLEDNVIPTKDTKLVLADGAITVPPIAIGAWQWGDKKVWNWTPEAEKDAKEAFDKAFELGIPFYDTAEVYGDGESEREIQRFRSKYTEEQQKQMVIATKFFPHDDRTNFPDVLLSALKDSLARLGTMDVDLYQIHAAIHPAEIEVVGNALADAYDAGLVKAVGVSNYSLDEIQRMHAALTKRGVPLASNQISFSLIRTIPEKSGLIKLCHDLGIAVLAYSPLGMGILTGKFGAKGPWPEGRQRTFSSLDTEQLTKLLDVLKNLSDKYNLPQSAIALNWCIVKGTIPLGGARTAEHVEQNNLALNFRLTPNEIAELDSHAFVGSNNKNWQHG